ncbi:Asp-tRNA(Asn)/Glu-tRNA(Gln) amidotransferase subunit GatC [Desulfonatronovibrio magnus]|uniref:Asp-tRNA(Asn)/Glu-tRNA(Gln) amidotransferase subunit GatC n=1 Tax=Desulfonatronovibrio magnus TaxID=698827 RepID=UPI0005EB2B4B|nr:Asp-tRNA(Asn)/Glu-tRNA(Gln) amidotransferase subunit GatC [Desulfonatronovibrio magnus]
MDISPQQIAKIASLARLELKDDQILKFAQQFNDIIGYMDKMNSLDTRGIEPMYSPCENTSVMRPDEVINEHERSKLLSNAPMQDGKYFIVPKII